MTLTHPNNPHNNESVYSDFKLFEHTERLEEWQRDGYASAPIVLDLDLTDKCNNKCPLCLYGSSPANSAFMPREKAMEIITDVAEMGTKAVTFAGGGDPTVHPDFEEVILHARRAGLETALFSNCYEMNDSLIRTIVSECTWMRVSLDADGPEIYKKTHAMDEEAFRQVIRNVQKITGGARKSGSDIRVGVTYLVGPHTAPGIYNAARLARDEWGVQEIRFRPFFNFSDGRISIEGLLERKGGRREEVLRDIRGQLERADGLKTESFNVSYPGYRFDALEGKGPRGFSTCYYPHFSASITADMKMYACCPLKGKPEYEIGDLRDSSFREVWNSEKRRTGAHGVVDFKSCSNPCQFHHHALLLSGIKGSQGNEHRNFL